jgi:hypothetical protein
MQIVLDEMKKDFTQKFVAFSYEDICKDIFKNLCRTGAVKFTPSLIGSYWKNDSWDDTQIDVMAVDRPKSCLFVGECKYHNKPVEQSVYFELKDKVAASADIRKSFPEYEVIYGIFSKSGFNSRLIELAKETPNLILINEDEVINSK